jgi:hypothetical protein
MANALITRPGPWMAVPGCPSGTCRPASRRSWRNLLAGFATGGLAVGTLAYAAAAWGPLALPGASAAAAPEAGPASPEASFARELPREWRWTPPSVSVEHMYRHRR